MLESSYITPTITPALHPSNSSAQSLLTGDSTAHANEHIPAT